MESFFACITCNRQVREAIYDRSFLPNLFSMLSAFIVLAVLVALLYAVGTRRHRKRAAGQPGVPAPSPVPLTTAAIILGIGIGGFIDGIVLHQVLQWHEMISNRLPPNTLVNKSVNMFWDGIFHAFTLIVTLIGILLLWKVLKKTDIDRSGRLLAGGMLTGWGIFNIVEGLINHHLLRLHNVREITASQDLWNYGFLGFSLILLLIGGALVKGRA